MTTPIEADENEDRNDQIREPHADWLDMQSAHYTSMAVRWELFGGDHVLHGVQRIERQIHFHQMLDLGTR